MCLMNHCGTLWTVLLSNQGNVVHVEGNEAQRKMSDTSVADIPMSAPKYVFISLFRYFFLTEINTLFQ